MEEMDNVYAGIYNASTKHFMRQKATPSLHKTIKTYSSTQILDKSFLLSDLVFCPLYQALN